MSGTIKLSGLSSGINFDEMVSKLVEAEKYQATKLETWKNDWQTKVDKLEELDTKAEAIQTANKDLMTAKTFNSKLGVSSDASIADVAVDSTASNGSYKIDVATASKHITSSKGYNNTSDLVGDGTLQFNVLDGSGANRSISVDTTGLTLSQVKDAIQTQISVVPTSNAKVDITNDGTASGQYRLQLTSSQAGTASKLSVTENGISMGFYSKTIDSVENVVGTSGSIVTSGGSYTGNVNKRMVFQVTSGGTVGSSAITIKWTDPVEDKTGSFTVSGAGTYNVAQGVQLTIGAGTMTKGDRFATDLFVPDVQQAQDTGLAQAAKVVHSGFADSDSSYISTTASIFKYRYAGNEVANIQVPSNTTLQGLVNLINSDPDNLGVTASIVNDGSGSATSSHLVLTGKNTGAANKIEILDTSSPITGFTSSTFTETQAATNSMVKIDGYPASDKYIQNESNLITDLIQGASVSIKSTGTTNITINTDTDAMAEKVKAFVDAYNDALDYIDDITKVVLNDNDEAKTSESGALVGNYGVNMTKSALKTFIGSSAIAFDSDVDGYSIFPQIGISTNADGSIAFDEELFKQELGKNPDQVVALFTANKAGITNNNAISYLSGTGLTKEGKYQVHATFDSATHLVTSGYYTEEGSSTQYAMSVSADGLYLTAKTGNAKGMAIQGVWNGNTSETALVRIRKGKAQEFDTKMNELFDDDSGITKVLEKNYESIMKNIDKRIDRELLRVEQVKTRLEEKFSRLEVNMQKASSLSDKISSQISSLKSSG